MEIMDVVSTEETVETMAEQSLTDIVKDVDWAKYGKIAGGVALAAAGAYIVYKQAPKAATKVKTLWTNHVERKQEKKAKNMIMVEEYEVNDVTEDENDK